VGGKDLNMAASLPDLGLDGMDPGVDAKRHSTQVYRYRVHHEGWAHDVAIRGRTYRNGEEVLLAGDAAYREAGHRLELLDPEPVQQTEDPATWEAQHATSVHVHLGPGLVVSHQGCRVRAVYAGDQGTARVNVVFGTDHWFVDGYLTLADAERLRDEIGRSIGEMKERMDREMDIDEDGCDHGGDIHLHQMGGSC
jgi:hypothetical protein